jgi:hypothetical protein
MRVAFKNMINGYAGKADNSIIYYVRKTNSFYMRRRPHQPIGETQNKFRDIMRNLGTLQPDYCYKEDFGFYLELYNQLPDKKYGAVMTWCNLYMKVMFSMARTYPDIDLTTITKEEIHARDLPCLSVNRAVDAGLLPMVKGYKRFSNEM